MADNDKLVQKGSRLLDLLLDDFERMLKDGSITAADRATLARMLKENGYAFDANSTKQNLGNKLTGKVDPKSVTKDDDVIPLFGT